MHPESIDVVIVLPATIRSIHSVRVRVPNNGDGGVSVGVRSL